MIFSVCGSKKSTLTHFWLDLDIVLPSCSWFLMFCNYPSSRFSHLLRQWLLKRISKNLFACFFQIAGTYSQSNVCRDTSLGKSSLYQDFCEHNPTKGYNPLENVRYFPLQNYPFLCARLNPSMKSILSDEENQLSAKT